MKLCGAVCTDPSDASGSGIYDLLTGKYAETYADAAGIEIAKLPQIVPSAQPIGHLLPEAAEALGLSRETLVLCGGADNACMALGSSCLRDGDMYASLGSSSWVAAASSVPATDLKLKPYVFAHCIPGMFLPHAGVNASGMAHKWAMGVLAYGNDYKEFDARIASAPVGANGVLFCPTLAGGNNADPSPAMQGGFFGLALSSTPEELARSVAEGIAMQLEYVTRRVFDILPAVLTVSGGGASTGLWRQIYADVFGIPMRTAAEVRSAAALGAAALASVGCGLYGGYDEALDSRAADGDAMLTRPTPKNKQIYDRQKRKFAAVMRASADIAAYDDPITAIMTEGGEKQ